MGLGAAHEGGAKGPGLPDRVGGTHQGGLWGEEGGGIAFCLGPLAGVCMTLKPKATAWALSLGASHHDSIPSRMGVLSTPLLTHTNTQTHTQTHANTHQHS